MEEDEVIFSKDVNVIFKDYDQRKSTLHVTVMVKLKPPMSKKELYVQLTNPTDLLFLQSFSLGEEEFQNLKNQQGLLVDFSTFPQKFVELLELCITEQNNAVPRFLLNFTCGSSIGQGTLDVVETNPFKHLVHLSLKFISGNDDEIKKYLATCLKKLQSESEYLKQTLANTERDLTARLNCTQQLLSEKTKEFDRLNDEKKEQVKNATAALQRELEEAKDRYSEFQRHTDQKMEQERRHYDSRYNKMVLELEDKLKHSQTSNKELTDQKYHLESLVRDMKSRLALLKEEKQTTTKDVQNLRRQNNHLDHDRHERDKTLNHLRTRVAVLEQELKDKEQVILRTNELIDTSTDQKRRLEHDLENKASQIYQLETTVKSVSAEVMKGNEIIQKLQGEMRSLKSRVKMMNIVTTKQERLIEEKDVLLKQNADEISSLKQENQTSQDKMNEIVKTKEELSRKLNESEETLKNNENVISWLNKQLNEQTLNRLSSTQNNSHSVTRIQYNSTRPTMATTTDSIRSLSLQNHGISKQSARVLDNDGNNIPNHQVPYRPILKKPQFQPPNGISPIVPTNHNRNPLRPKQQMSTPVIREETPILEPKYLKGTPGARGEEQNENIDPNAPHKNAGSTTSKPFVIASAYFKEQS